jgi:hypothetical protein
VTDPQRIHSFVQWLILRGYIHLYSGWSTEDAFICTVADPQSIRSFVQWLILRGYIHLYSG